LERLKSEGIASEMQAIAAEGGLDIRELLVSDILYERACEASSIVCLERGQYILKRERLLGWFCIVIGIIPLLLVLAVMVRNEIRIHS